MLRGSKQKIFTHWVSRDLLRANCAAGAGARLDADERVHAPQRLRRLPPHDVAPDQRLQLHQPPQRLERPPRLRAERQAGAEGLISNGPVAMGVSHLQWKPGVGNLAGMPTTTAITTPTALAPSKKSNAVNWVETAKKASQFLVKEMELDA